MSVDYTPILFVGKEFDNQYEAAEFIEKYFELSEEEKQAIEKDGIVEWCYGREDIDASETNCYVDDAPVVIGYELGVRDTEAFTRHVDEAVEQWEEKFPAIPFEIIHTVCVS